MPELEAYKELEVKVIEKNLDLYKVAGKMFVLYKNLLSKNAQIKRSTIVASLIRASPWTDLKGTVHTVAQSPLAQPFEECVLVLR